MVLTEQELEQLLSLTLTLNVAAVVFGLIIYDLLGMALSRLARLMTPTKQGCTPAGGVEDECLDVNSTSGAVSTPEVSCRTSGQNSRGGADE